MGVITQHGRREHCWQKLRQVGACSQKMAGDSKVARRARGSARGGAGHVLMWDPVEDSIDNQPNTTLCWVKVGGLYGSVLLFVKMRQKTFHSCTTKSTMPTTVLDISEVSPNDRAEQPQRLLQTETVKEKVRKTLSAFDLQEGFTGCYLECERRTLLTPDVLWFKAIITTCLLLTPTIRLQRKQLRILESVSTPIPLRWSTVWTSNWRLPSR